MKGPMRIMARLQEHPCATIFLKAIDPEQYPDYYQVIREPMDLSLIKERLEKRRYQSLKSWERDMRLIHENAQKYFGKESAQAALASHLVHLFDKEFERCAEDGLSRWTRLYAAHTNRVLHRLSTLPEVLDPMYAIVGAFSFAIPVREESVTEEVWTPPRESRVSSEQSDVISQRDQDRFLESVGSLGQREAKRFVEIVHKFHPNLISHGPDFDIPVEQLSAECWTELIAFAQRRFREMGWTYPI
jgi:hypothetical protein